MYKMLFWYWNPKYNYDLDPDPEQFLDFDKNFVVRYQILWIPLIFRA